MPRSSRKDFCPEFHHAVELIGRRWTGVILRAMLNGATHFGEIAVAVPKLSDRMLAARLKELEAHGVIERTVVPDTPVRVEYALTDKGRALEGVLIALGDWADRWVAPRPVGGAPGYRTPRKPSPARGRRTRRRPSSGQKPT
jgi:DNA-binding HxlR family transcriptional regulator